MDLKMREDELTCAACGEDNLSRRMEMDEFEYGAGQSDVPLSANVVVFTCNDCDFEFTGPSAEVARHEAVCRHLGIMTPAEIRELRGRYALSRQSFCVNHAAGRSLDRPVGDRFASSESRVR